MMRTVLLLAVPALLVAQSQSTFYAAYEDGLEFQRAGRWKEAAAAYQRAIVLRPRPAAKVVTYGNNLLFEYYPYAQSARCQLELGQAEAARALLLRSESMGEPESARAGLLARLPAVQEPAIPPAASPVAAPQPSTPPVQPASPVLPPPREDPEPRPRVPALPPPPPRPKPADQPPPSTTAAVIKAPSPPPPAQPSVTPPAQPAVPAPATPRPWLSILSILAGLAATGLVLLAILRRRRPAGDDAGYQDPVQVGPYQIGRLLGRGGFASTYQAWHPETGDKVAVKVLHPFRQDDPEFVGRFRQEARLGTLLDHPNLVRMLDRGPDEGLPWLVMEFVSGERLDQHLRAAGQLSIAEAVSLSREIASAMAHAHALGVVHRDLKPSNVMLADGHAKVMDFGICRRMDSETLTTTYAFLGTPLYAAPEAQMKAQVGPASDRYALGIMLFEMLAGRPPFTGETPFEILDQHRSAALPDLAALRPGLPESLRFLVEGLCRKDPSERPGDDDLLRMLDALAEETARPSG
jgi:hypothetical protein